MSGWGLTTVVFDNDETVLAAKSGFEGGWDIATEGNRFLSVHARPYKRLEIGNDSKFKDT